MPDVFDRDGKEAALAKVVAREFHRARLALLGLIPELDDWMVDVAPEFWGEHRANLVGDMTPIMSGVYVSQAETLMEEFAFLGVDWGLVNTSAANWARNYTFNLVGGVPGINNTTREFLQRTIPQYFELGWTQGQLRDALAPKGKDGEDIGPFGTKRAGVIARTEVTRAASEGEIEIGIQLAKDGITMRYFWNTRFDEDVCPICRPLNEVIATGVVSGRPYWIHPDSGDKYGPPPDSHPSCRCWLGQELVSTV